MTPLVTLVIAAGQALALDLAAPAPGVAGRDNSFVVTGATPGLSVRMVASEVPGAFEVPGCPGVFVDVADFDISPPVVADGGGVAVFARHIPAQHAGSSWLFQAVQAGACDVSPLLGYGWPPIHYRALAGAEDRMRGEAAGDIAGISVGGAGDVNADGLGDFIVGASGHDGNGAAAGAAYVVLGPPSGTFDLSAAEARFDGAAGDGAGRAVAGGFDVDNDGNDDVIIGAHHHGANGLNAGAAYLVRAPMAGDLTATARLLGEAAQHLAGVSVAGAGDVYDDGTADLLIGAKGHDAMGFEAGAAYIVDGGVVGDLDLGAAPARLLGEAAGDVAGRAAAGAGDVDGDGFTDVLVGAHENDAVALDSGAAYLVLGPAIGDIPLATADARFRGVEMLHEAGASVAGAGDVNGDGFDDVLIGCIGLDPGGLQNAGGAYLLYGPLSGGIGLPTSDATLVGEAPGDRAGIAVSSAGDVNGDGFVDLLIGAHHRHNRGGGAAYVVLGPAWGSVELAAAQAILLAEAPNDQAGISVAGAGDVDGDGLADLLVGANQQDAGGQDAGAAYLVLSPL